MVGSRQTAKAFAATALVALVACGVVPPAAGADGIGLSAAAAGGVTVRGSEYRYTSLSPGRQGRLTLVARTDRRGGRVSRWWYLRGGSYDVPAVAYDGTAGGLSADGGTLVLSRFSPTYPSRMSRFAILDTDLHLRHPLRAGQDRPRHAVDRVALKGDFSFDAISPDGSTVYLIHQGLSRDRGPAHVTDYEVRAFDVASGKLLPGQIVDPSEPDEQMQGLPVTRASSPDGRWAYTLYYGNDEPFVHALDTVRRRAVCIDLPQLEGRRDLFSLELQTEAHGGRLAVLSRTPPGRASKTVLAIDTRGFDVEETSSGDDRAGGGLPWLAIVPALAALLLGIAWVAGRRPPTGEAGPPRRA